MIRSAGLLLVALLLAACTSAPGPNPSPTTGTSPSGGADAPFVLPNNASDCTEVSPAVFIEPAAAQRFLPAGFRPGDAKDFLGLPGAMTGKAVVLITAVKCKTSPWAPDGYSEGAVAIFVQPPNVPGVQASPSNMYELGRATNQANLSSLLAAVGWHQIGNSVENAFTAAPPTGSGRVSDVAGAVYSYGVAVEPASVDFPVDIRWWHNATLGLAFFDYKFTAKAQFGALQQCTFRAGSFAANITGGTGCPRDNVVLVAPSFAFTGQFRLLTDTRAR